MASRSGIQTLFSAAVCEQILEDIAANEGSEILWWGKLSQADTTINKDSATDAKVTFVEAAACGNEESVLAHFPYMERGDVVVHNHPSGPVQPSQADLAVAAELAMQGIGFYIVDNLLSKICVVAKPVLETQEQALDLEELSNLLGPAGPLAQKAAQYGTEYEQRPAQQELLRLVGSAFNEKKLAVAEGSTGIGKSFAYLLPAAFWAVRNKQRIIISTATINLQQQLVEKDIPLIRKISGLEELQAVLAKGRSNYLCLRRLQQSQGDEGPELELGGEKPDELLYRTELKNIAQWAAVTQDGSLSDLGFRPQSGVWNQVCGESDNCLGLRCEFHEACFIIRARRRAAAAHLLIVNHHLLFADLALRSEVGYEKTAVLPPYRHVIIDEAHNIERSAQSFFSRGLGKFSAQRSLRRLYSKSRNRERGLWAHLKRYAELEAGNAGELPDILACCEDVEQALAALESIASGLLDPKCPNLRIPNSWSALPEAEVLAGQLWPQLERVRIALSALLKALRQVYDLLENVLEGEEQNLLLEWQLLARRLEGLSDLVLRWQAWHLGSQQEEPQPSDKTEEDREPASEEDEQVFWLERRRKTAVSLMTTQINIGSLLQEVLYQPMHSVVLVSATLTVGGQFDYWFSRVGLGGYLPTPDENRKALEAAVFDSSFCYQKQVRLLLASDAPNPSSGNPFDDYVARFTQQALEHTGGRSLLLFTSYTALNKCHQYLQEHLDLGLLRQGDDDSTRLLQRFKKEETLSLLATDSFWEGVDAPGSTLVQVLLCRLPFRSPGDPIVAAHMEFLERRGENSFANYSLPEAVLRFRQGFGRLMRRSSDHGLVVVLDPRLANKHYGQSFLSSLPPAEIIRGNFATLQHHICEYAAERL